MKTIDWGSLGFTYMKTNYNIRAYYRDGKWSELEVSDSEYIPMHMAASCLHYSQEAFEGLKAYCGADGKIRLFRVEENAKRLINSARYLCMAEPSIEMFVEACKKAVQLNREFVPPYGTGASLYLRPLLIGTSPQIGVGPASEYMFMVFVMPVGPYFKSGFKPIKVIIDRDHDRAAPKGTGHIKAGGNYAASIYSGEKAHDMGYSNVLYLDAVERKYIDECGAANFFGIKNNTYITPNSHSVLPSITNMSIRELAADLGLKVEMRKIEVSELGTFEECGACGTAAVISPIGSVYDPDTNHTYTFGDGTTAGPICEKMYNTLRGIQYGEIEDTHNWCTIVE